MKKGFLLSLLFSLLMVAPSITEAEEIGDVNIARGLSNIVGGLNPLDLSLRVLNDSSNGAVVEEVSYSPSNEVELQGDESSSNFDTDSTEEMTVQQTENIVSNESVRQNETVMDDSAKNVTNNSGLGIKLGLPIIGEVNLNLLNKVESGSEENKLSSNSLLEVSVLNSEVLGNTNLSVLGENSNSGESASNLISVDLDNDLVGKTQIGLAEEEKGNLSDALGDILRVELDLPLLGDTQIKVGEIGDILPLPIVVIPGEKNEDSDSNDQSGSEVDSGDTPSNPSNQGNSGNTNSEEPGNSGHPGSSTNVKSPDNPKNPIPAKDRLGIDEEKQSLISNGKENHSQTQPNEDLLNTEETHLLYGINHDDFSAIDGLTSESNNKLQPEKENNLAEWKKFINQVNKNEQENMKLAAPSGMLIPNSGSTSGLSGASNTSGGTGLFAYLDFDYVNEVKLSNQLFDRSLELMDQWMKSPPNDPPKASFFLNR